MNKPILVATLSLATCLVPHGTGSVAHAKTQDSDLRTRLNSAIPGIMRTGDVPGLEAAVIRDGKLYWLGAFGVREATSPARVERITIFRAASLTKPLFAYLVLRLADHGVLDLDAPVVDKLPYFGSTPDPRVRKITPRMLLSHSSGIPNCCGPQWALTSDPGTAWDYSPRGYDWLGALVEQLTGQTLNEVAMREVFRPLGMTHSSLVWNDALEANAASPHTMWGKVARAARPATPAMDKAYASGSLRTTAEDYAKFLVAAMDGRGLSARSAPLLFSPQVELRNSPAQRGKPEALLQRMAWGLGFGVARTDSGSEFWQWGDYGDSKAFVIGDARRHTAIVYFANAQTGLTIAGNIVSLVFPGELYPMTLLGYPSINDLPRLARRAVVIAALDSGAAAGARRLQRERAEHPERVTLEQVEAAAGNLGQEHAVAAADTLLSLAGLYWPDSVAVPIDRGDLQLTNGGGATRAADYYRRALVIAPESPVAKARLEWALADIRARTAPASVSVGDLQRLVGSYGRWTIGLDGGRLTYRRGDDAPAPLIAMSGHTFVPVTDTGMRLHFTLDPTPVLMEETFSGETNRNERNP